jgi:hypothetical protein
MDPAPSLDALPPLDIVLLPTITTITSTIPP